MTRLFLLLLIFLTMPLASLAASKAEIDLTINETLTKLYKQFPETKSLLAKSEAVLVFPKVYKAGAFFIGGQYGEGALRMADQTTAYYKLKSGSLGFQLGAQKKSVVLLFLDKTALNNFYSNDKWEVGVDASVAVIDLGAAGKIDSTKLNKPIIAFVLDQKGLMYNLTLEGTVFSRMKK